MAFPVRVWRYLCRPGAEQFSCEPGSAVIVVIYACAVACGRSFTVLSDRPSYQFLECFLPPSSSLLLFLSLLLLLLLVIIVVIISTKPGVSTELLALCDGCLGWGWVWQSGLVAGLRLE